MSNQFAPFEQKSPPFYPEPPRESGSGCLWGLAIGCLGTVVVCGLLCAGGVWYVQQNAGRWVTGFVREAIVATINGSEIPEGEKKEVIEQVDRVVDAFKSGRLDSDDFEPLMKDLSESPAFLLMSAWGLEKAYLEPSGLSNEEKEAGRRTIDRAFRGLCEKKITHEQFARVMPQQYHHAKVEAEVKRAQPVNVKMRPSDGRLTDEEVRTMLADLKKLADDAEIPDEPFEIDIGDEVKKVVDEALAGKGVP